MASEQTETRAPTPVRGGAESKGEHAPGASESSRRGGLRRELAGMAFADGERHLAVDGAHAKATAPDAPVQRQEGKRASKTTRGAATKGAATKGASTRETEGGPAADGGDAAAEVELRSAGLSFSLPANRRLAASAFLFQGDAYEARTREATLVQLVVDRRGLHVSCSPSLFFDFQWPLQNCQLRSAGVSFTTGQSYANVSLVRGMGQGFLDVGALAPHVAGEIRAMIDGAIAGTDMASPGFDPISQPELLLPILARIKSNFESMPAGGGGPAPDIAARDVTHPTVSGTLAMRTPFFRSGGDVGLRIPAGGTFSFEVFGSGNLGDILRAGGGGDALAKGGGDRQAAAMAAAIHGVRLSSEAIELVRNGEALAKLQDIQVSPGGQVTLRRFEMLGGLGAGAGIEALIRLFAGIARYGGMGAPPELGARITVARGEAEPTLVEGLSRSMIEDGLSTAVRQLLRDNRHALPGLDLALVFGVRE